MLLTCHVHDNENIKKLPYTKSIEKETWSSHSNKGKPNIIRKKCKINQYNKRISWNNEAKTVNNITVKRSFSKYILNFDVDYAWFICSWQSIVYSFIEND